MTFFVDRNLGYGLREPLQRLGFEVVLHDELFAQNGDDVEWLEHASIHGFPALSPDKNIMRRRLELQAVIDGRLRYFCFGSGRADTGTRIKILEKHIGSIKALCVHMPGPYVARLTGQNLQFHWLGD